MTADTFLVAIQGLGAKSAQGADRRRRSPRAGMRMPLDILVLGRPAESTLVKAHLRDVSSDGIGFTCSRVLNVDQRIAVRLLRIGEPPMIAVFRVTRCAPAGLRLFLVGASMVGMKG
jgi:hypothetical protein